MNGCRRLFFSILFSGFVIGVSVRILDNRRFSFFLVEFVYFFSFLIRFFVIRIIFFMLRDCYEINNNKIYEIDFRLRN